MFAGRPLVARRATSGMVVCTVAAFDALESSTAFFSCDPARDTPTSNPVMPDASDGISGLYDSAAPRSSDRSLNSDCDSWSTVVTL